MQDARFVNYWYLGGKEKKGPTTPIEAPKESKVLEAVKKLDTKPAGA